MSSSGYLRNAITSIYSVNACRVGPHQIFTGPGLCSCGRAGTFVTAESARVYQSRCRARYLHVTPTRKFPPAPPKNKDRGPKSEEDTQTDFRAMDMLSNTPVPTTAVDACMDDGFALDSGLKVSGSGVLLMGGEAFKWRPWVTKGRKEGTIGEGASGDDPKGVASLAGKLQNTKRQLEISGEAWGVLDLVWPKPDLLILGTGIKMIPISPATRKHINDLGIRVEIQDTRNAAAQFNLLATERGVQQVAAALIPIGWREGS